LNKMFEVANNLSHHAGAHAVRVGADFLYNDCTIAYPRSFRGSYTFSSLPNFLNGVYNNVGFTQTFGDPVIAQTNPNIGFFVQDEWKVSQRFTLNAGLRYDLQFLETINSDKNNFSPRIGFAWTPFEARRTVVRGSYGLFYDRIPLRALANALLSAGNTSNIANLRQINVSLSPNQAGAPVFPNILSSVVTTQTLVNLTTMDRNMQNAYSQQFSAEVEQQIGQRGTLSLGYQRLRGLHLIVSVNQNVPSCVAAGTNTPTQTTASILRLPIPTTTACIFPSCSGPRVGAAFASLTPIPRRTTTSASSSSARPSIHSTSGRTTGVPMTISAIAWL
jgi:hypothetical protein